MVLASAERAAVPATAAPSADRSKVKPAWMGADKVIDGFDVSGKPMESAAGTWACHAERRHRRDEVHVHEVAGGRGGRREVAVVGVGAGVDAVRSGPLVIPAPKPPGIAE